MAERRLKGIAGKAQTKAIVMSLHALRWPREKLPVAREGKDAERPEPSSVIPS